MVHHRTHAPIKPTPLIGPWNCNVCNAKFTDIKAHVEHMGSHALDYPSPCPLCLSRFKNPSDLGNHACVANNKSRPSNLSSENVNKINKSSKCVISETKEKAVQQEDKILAKSIYAGPSSSAKQFVNEDASDESDVEACINFLNSVYNPSTSDCPESNNNVSGLETSDFLVKDPWQASSALIDADYCENDAEMAVGNYAQNICINEDIRCNNTSSRSSHSSALEKIDDFINDLINPDNYLENQDSKGRSRRKKREVPETSTASYSTEDFTEINDIGKKMPRGIVSPATHPPSDAQSPINSLDDMSEAGEIDPAIASQHGVPNHPEDPTDKLTSGFRQSLCTKYTCTQCHLSFFENKSWIDHVKYHIYHGPFAEVSINKIAVIDVGTEIPKFTVSKDTRGNYSVSSKLSMTTLDESELEIISKDRRKSSKSQISSESSSTSTAEQKKEGLKLTFCRKAGTIYNVKRKSTDSSEAASPQESTSAKSRRLSQTDLPPPTLESVPKVTSSPAVDNHTFSNMEVPTTTTTSSSSVSKDITKHPGNEQSQIGDGRSKFIPRFLMQARTVLNSIKNRKKVDNQPSQLQSQSAQVSTQASSMPSLKTGEGARREDELSVLSNAMTSSKSPINTSSNSNNSDKEKLNQQQRSLNIESQLNASQKENAPSKSKEFTNADPKSKISSVARNKGSDVAEESPISSTRSDSIVMTKSGSQNEQHAGSHAGSSTGDLSTNESSSKNTTTENERHPLSASINSNDTSPHDGETNSDADKSNERLESHSSVNDDGYDENRLIIAEEMNETVAEGRQGKVNDKNVTVELVDNTTDINGDDDIGDDDANKLRKKNSTEITEPISPAEDTDNSRDKRSPIASRKNPSQDDSNEDFRCQVCQEMFSNEDEVNDHFSEVHFRPVGNSILEPESPFPTVTVEGTSSLFEDEVEETIPFPIPVETQLIEVNERPMPTLTRRISNGGREPNYPVRLPGNMMRGDERGQENFRMPMMRQQVPMGRVEIPPNTSVQRPVMMGPPGAQPGGPHNLNRPLGYPTALHQALIRPTGHGQAPPQLRPMPSMHNPRIPGQPPHSRPQLTRVPQPTANQISLQQGPSRNPQSILRPGPVQHQQLNSMNADIVTLEKKIHELEVDIKKIESMMENPQMNHLNRSLYQQRRADCMRYHQVLMSQLATHRSQEALKRQQLNQQSQQHLQQQQMRQQQLQQTSRMNQHQQATTIHHHHHHQNLGIVNANGKRPVAIMDAVEMSNRPKQVRLESLLVGESLPPSMEHAPRMPNGITIRPVIHPQNMNQTVEPGMNSGDSNSSRHSSRSNSPAVPSPIPQRHNGVTLTPTSPAAPLTPLTPPENPNLSPISDQSPNPSPRGSPRGLTVDHIVQMAVGSGSPITSPRAHITQQPNSNFAMPKAPGPLRQGEGNMIVTNHTAERPDRPPTIDLTEDDIMFHQAQMRIAGRGIVTKEQLQKHGELLQQRRLPGLPGTSHFTIRPVNNPPSQGPVSTQVQSRPVGCPHCHLAFNTADAMNEHVFMAHRQHPGGVHPQNFRPPQQTTQQQQPSGTLVRRVSPPSNISNARPNVIQLATSPPRPMMQVRERLPAPNIIIPRQQEQSPPSLTSKESRNLVVPLLNIDLLDSARIKALNELGVISFIPVEGIKKFGIPILRLAPNVNLGHFPHDTAVEIGQSCHLLSSQEPQRSIQPPPRRTPPTTNIPAPNHAVAPPSHHQVRPPSVISPPMGTICNDRSCPDAMRRPSPTSVIHHLSSHMHPSSMSIRPAQPSNVHANQYSHRQQLNAHHHHDSFLGGTQFGGNRN